MYNFIMNDFFDLEFFIILIVGLLITFGFVEIRAYKKSRKKYGDKKEFKDKKK